ncbi:hypothetical protein JCM10212_006305, partial [Sporobolomyces blumeae]
MSSPTYEENGTSSASNKHHEPTHLSLESDEPAVRAESSTVTRQPQAAETGLMNVQALRKADMQPSYAQ